jgi:hypothetical protein
MVMGLKIWKLSNPDVEPATFRSLAIYANQAHKKKKEKKKKKKKKKKKRSRKKKRKKKKKKLKLVNLSD